ncbi:MAG: NADPH-dependent FMN reductase [Planctomycetota bacterium]
MQYAVLSSSHHPDSRSRRLARLAFARLLAHDARVRYVDLAERNLPLCDGSTCYGHPEAARLRDDLTDVDGMIIATPIYNYSGNAVLKNAIELTGRNVWSERIVGFLCAAGGGSSYMSIMGLANSLMLDFRTVDVPRFVYAQQHEVEPPETGLTAGKEGMVRSALNATSPDADDAALTAGVKPEIVERIDGLVEDVMRFTAALRPVRAGAASD